MLRGRAVEVVGGRFHGLRNACTNRCAFTMSSSLQALVSPVLVQALAIVVDGREFAALDPTSDAFAQAEPHTSYWHIHTEKKKRGKMRIKIRHKRTRTSPVKTGPSMLLQPQPCTTAPSHARRVQCASTCSAIRSKLHVNARGGPWSGMGRTGCISGLGTRSERGSRWWWKGREDEWGRCEGVVQNAETVAGRFENVSAGWCSEGEGKEGANQSRAMIHSPLSTTPFALACIEIAHRHHRCTSNTLLTCEDG
jgi:hypothetical protein